MILPGGPEDALASLTLAAYSALLVRQQDMELEAASDFDGPPTERDSSPPSHETWAPTTCPTLPAIYSRSAA